MRNSDFLPSYGPLHIENYPDYLKWSKEIFGYKDENFFTEKITCFEILRKIGEGNYGSVYMTKHRFTKNFFTVKAVRSSVVTDAEIYSRIEQERDIVLRLNHPFIVKLASFTSDSNYMYFITPYYSGGDLLENLEKKGKFTEEQTRFISAQVVLALEYLHYLDVIYRDVKPANIVFDHTGYIKLIDFAYSKICSTRTYTICGTETYMAPEIFTGTGHGKAVDWWALGVLLFEINSGRLPSIAMNSERPVSANERKYDTPSDFSGDLSDLINSLIQVDENHRLGNLTGGVDDVKNHAWFASTLWLPTLNRKIDPPYTPLQRPQLELNRKEEHDLRIEDDESDDSKDLTPDESPSDVTPSDFSSF